MPTRNVNLTAELDRFVLDKVKRGRYENASEVVRAALRMLERDEHQYEVKLAALRKSIDEGDSSGVAEGNVFARVRKTLNLRHFSVSRPVPTQLCWISANIRYRPGATTRRSGI
jgi:antitoxin ParD1/3/4